ncbi:nitrous oxide reductase accessory protein NosL [Bergeyella sp. RCAD1439]|uniref:nitrous oxide reductase accessory protein NosL n=1 Tax=Bergeyella anatis TaxID=3113737 RepID=UPI002E19227E|nr:nitrous oxide reductase accessory protein NosL [Bergeyella sp. RCAD1439]
MKYYVFTLWMALVTLTSFSCTSKEVEPFVLGKDQCSHCKMVIQDARYATELITEKGRVYKFDDLACMEAYAKENSSGIGQARFYVSDFATLDLFPLEKAFKITGGQVKSPMNGNVAAFKSKDEALKQAHKLQASLVK